MGGNRRRREQNQQQTQNAPRPFFSSIYQPTLPFFGFNPRSQSPLTPAQQQQRNETVAQAEQGMIANNAEPQNTQEPTSTTQTEPQESQGESTSSNRDYLGELVGGLVESQLGNAGFRDHINTLAGELQSLAENATDDVLHDPSRLAALGVENAFKNAATEILNDPALSAVRQAIINTVTENDEVALVTALAAVLAAYFMDYGLEGSPEFELGQGATLGGEFDLGSAQDVEFNKLQLFFQYANDYFQSRSTISLRREVSEPDAETGDVGGEESFVGTAIGMMRFGTDLLHLRGSYTLGTDGTAIFTGRISAGYEFGNSNRFVFTTDVTHNVQEDSTVFRPGVDLRFNLGNNQSIQLGATANVDTDNGLEGLSGHIEYQRSWFQVRLEGNMEGIQEDNSLSPPISETGEFGLQPLHFQGVLRGMF